MRDIILTEKQLEKIVHLIKQRPIIENDESKYTLADLEAAFEAGRRYNPWSDHEGEIDYKFWDFQDWFNNGKFGKEIMEGKDGSYMSKQQLFTIATLAYKMWEKIEDGEQLEDWMESKIAQAEQSVVAVVKAYMYDDVEDKMKGMDKLDHNDLIIGN
jgi:hypothetical protein